MTDATLNDSDVNFLQEGKQTYYLMIPKVPITKLTSFKLQKMHLISD